MAYSTKQQQIAGRLKEIARRQGATRKQTKALLEAGDVESGFRNLSYGDRDSVGVLQQRPSQGWGPAGESVEKDAVQFLNKAKQADNSGSAGQLAQAVQRSAFPARYDARGGAVEGLLGSQQPSSAPKATASSLPAPDRAALVSAYMANRGKPGALLSFVSGMKTPTPAPAKGPTGAKGTSGDTQAQTVLEAGKIAQQMGLRVGEQSAFGGKPSGGHAPNSWHYKDRAIDVSGDPKKMLAFNRRMAAEGGRLKELFYNGSGGKNFKNGKPVQTGFVSGHTDHVHVAM